MKILIITPHFPYPLYSGGNKAQYLLIDNLRHKFEITLVCPFAYSDDYLKLKDQWKNVEIKIFKIIDNKDSKHTSLCSKIKNIAKKTLNFSISKFWNFIKSRKTRSINDIAWNKKRFHHTYIFNYKIDNAFVNYISCITKESLYDIIQVEFIQLISLVVALPKNVKKIFIHHEIGFIRTDRELSTLSHVEAYDNYIATINKQSEVFYLNEYDKIIVFSDIDRKILIENNIIRPISISPFPIVVEGNTFHSKSFVLKNLIFLGGEGHYPNLDALDWFVTSFLNQIHDEFPELKFKVIGFWSKETIKRYKRASNIEFLGYIENLQSVIKDSLLIVPLRIGSGIRTKILEAFSIELPVISTAIGIEGIPATPNHHYFHADDIDQLIHTIKSIKSDIQTIEAIKSNARQFVALKYSIDSCTNLRARNYYELLS